MDKKAKKAKPRKTKDLQVDEQTGAKVKGGRDLVPSREAVVININKKFARP